MLTSCQELFQALHILSHTVLVGEAHSESKMRAQNVDEGGGRVLGSTLGQGRDRNGQDWAGVGQPHWRLWSWDGPAELPEWRQDARPLNPCDDQLLRPWKKV